MKAILTKRQNKGGIVWRCRFLDHAGIMRWLSLYPQKEPSETARAMIERIVSFRESGRPLDPDMLNWLDANGAIRDKFAEWGIVDAKTASAIKPIADLLTEWDAVTGGELNQRYRLERLAQVKKAVAFCRFRSLMEVKAPAVVRFLDHLTASGGRDGKGASNRTRNGYLVDPAKPRFSGKPLAAGVGRVRNI